MKKKRVLICGAGSIGIYLGAKLYSKNHDVILFGRRKLKGIKDKIIIENKEFKIPKKIFRITPNSKFDCIFITSKLYDLDSIIKTIKKNKIKGKIIAGVQNGLVDISKYSRILGKEILPIVAFCGFNLQGDKINITPTPLGWKIENSRIGRKISKLLLDANIPCTADKRFNSLRAEKTIVNCCLNGLSAIENKPFCDLFKNKKTRERINCLFEECYNILNRYYKLDSAKKIKKRLFADWSKLKHHSSTCQDVLSGRKTEIDFFNGYIVRLGKEKNLPAENNQKIVEEVNKISKK